MKYFSVFSGVEGFGQGFPKEWECVGFSETDKYCSMVLKYHFPNVKNYGDITEIDWSEVPDFDVFVGGSPCQDFSIAGKRKGLQGSRSALAWEFIRGLRSKKPRYFIWENVKGVMSSRSGWDFANLLCAFSESGYDLWWQVLNAKDFGVPQNRERVFVVGFREGCSKEVFFERESGKEVDELYGQQVGAITARRGEAKSDGDYIIESGGETQIFDGYNRKFTEGIGAIGQNMLNGGSLIVENKGASQHYRVYGQEGLAPTLQSQSGMSSQKHPFIVASRGRNPKNPKSTKSGLPTEQMLEPNLTGNSNTLTGIAKDNYVFDGKVRKLMPIECERLMSWQDDWTKYGTDEKGNKVEISDSQRYKMCGNGVVSNVVKELAKTLLVNTP